MKTSAVLIYVFFAISAIAQPGSSDRARMAIPGVKGILELEVGPTSFQTRVRPDGEMKAFGRPDQLEITAFLQRVAFPASAEKCRDEWWPGTKKAPFRRDNLQESLVKDGIARVEYIIPEFQGIKVRQKNLHAYLGSGDLCAEIHMSKAGFEPDDQKLFETVLSSIKLLPDESPSETQGQTKSAGQPDEALRYFSQGSKFHLQRDYSAAADQYQKALDLESHRSRRSLWPESISH